MSPSGARSVDLCCDLTCADSLQIKLRGAVKALRPGSLTWMFAFPDVGTEANGARLTTLLSVHCEQADGALRRAVSGISASFGGPRQSLQVKLARRVVKGVGLMNKHRETAYALLRATLGVVFLFYGVGKFMAGIGNVAQKMQQPFAGKLPSALVLPFLYALPFMEVIFGALILLGLFNRIALVASGLLLLALTFGTVMLGDAPTVAHNLQYALVNFVLLWFADYNGYSIDCLRQGVTSGKV